MTDLLDLLIPPPRHDGRVYGVVTGVVTNNQDPEGIGRVKLRFPWLSDTDESNWARCVTFMGGAEMGAFFLPEVDDEVLVAFEHGRIDHPYVVGSLWNANALPPAKNDDGKNPFRMIRSRSGHVVRLDDTDGKEKIEIVDKSEKNSIVIDTSKNALVVTVEGDITLTAKGKIVLDCEAFEVTTKADVKLTPGGNFAVKATGNADVEGGGPMTLKGATVAIN
jgi:uncharacterized protein involved in type VI secretion and phage assembly